MRVLRPARRSPRTIACELRPLTSLRPDPFFSGEKLAYFGDQNFDNVCRRINAKDSLLKNFSNN